MNHCERFFATIHHQPVDRPASWLGLPVPSAEQALLEHFWVSNMDELRTAIGDDIFPIEVPYNFPLSNHVACAFNFLKVSHLDTTIPAIPDKVSKPFQGWAYILNSLLINS